MIAVLLDEDLFEGRAGYRQIAAQVHTEFVPGGADGRFANPVLMLPQPGLHGYAKKGV